MYNVLIKLIVAAALVELGISLSRDMECGTRLCWDQVEEGGRKMLQIEWRPISIFPEEAKRFQENQ